MRHKLSEYKYSLNSLIYTPQRSDHVGLTLVWIYEYIVLCLGVKDGRFMDCSRKVYENQLSLACRDFVTALATYRNNYVHAGIHDVKTWLLVLRNFTVRDVVNDLFDTVNLPEHARDVFWKWYEGEVKE